MEKFRLLPASDKVNPETIAHIARHAVRQNGDDTWTVKADRRFHATRPETDQRAGWLRVETPALLVAGELSDRLKSDSLEWVRGKVPQVETAVIPGAHHHVFMDEPEAFIRVTREFLKRKIAATSERSASRTA
ncbi:MAG: alpha/beta hydrolase [Nitrospinae bacterium]|nr:alpha/beta hydrolase [Nitrospinota bacterium]